MAIFRLIDWQQTCKQLYFGMRLVYHGGGLGLDGGTRSRVCWVGRVMWVHGSYCADLGRHNSTHASTLFISEITVNEVVRSGPILVQSSVIRNLYVLNSMPKSPVIKGLCLKHRCTMRMNMSRLTLTLWSLTTHIGVVPHRKPLNISFYIFIQQI